jgi:hypothetical protein
MIVSTAAILSSQHQPSKGKHQPSNVYREQLSSLYHGCALWRPEPVENLYDKVSIGDVGYIYNGSFYRMFNVMEPWDKSPPVNQRFGEPDQYKPLVLSPFVNHRQSRFSKGDYYSRNVSSQEIHKVTAQTPRE